MVDITCHLIYSQGHSHWNNIVHWKQLSKYSIKRGMYKIYYSGDL